MQQPHSYSAQPQAAPIRKNKTKYRDEGGDENIDMGINQMQNLMHDPRVVRGSTYAAKLDNTNNASKVPGTKSPNRGKASKKFVGRRVSTPPPVDGRSHMVMQTEDFLEELTDRPIEIDQETQTQAYMDRPASPLFVRAKVGYDRQTQIENGDLFDFDLEVEPILELLVGKTLHVSMLELMQEEELEAIRLQQQEFEAVRNVELGEVQRLEAEARRKSQEKERRVAQERKRVAEKKDLEQKIAARCFTQQYLGALHIGVFDLLQQQGVFYDPVQKEVEDIFMVELLSQVRQRVDCYNAAVEVSIELVEEAKKRSKEFEMEAIRLRKELADRLAKELAEKLAEEARLAEEKRLAEEAAAAAEGGGGGEE